VILTFFLEFCPTMKDQCKNGGSLK